MYGCAKKDIYLMCAVSIGVLANAYGCFTALQLLAKENRTSALHTMENILMVGISMWVFIGFFVGIIAGVITTDENALSINVLGSLCTGLAIAYYMSPLSKVLDIVRSRDVSSLYMPMLVMNLITSLLWAAYGLLGANDLFLFMCNAFAFVVTFFMIILKLVFMNFSPKKADISDIELAGVKNDFSTGESIEKNVAEISVFEGRSRNTSFDEVPTGIRRRASSLGEFASKVLGMDAPPAGFVPLANEEQKDNDDGSLGSGGGSSQGRTRRSSSVSEMAAAAFLTTLDVLAVAPPDNRSSVMSMGGKTGEYFSVRSPTRPTRDTYKEEDVVEDRAQSTFAFPPTTGAILQPLPEDAETKFSF